MSFFFSQKQKAKSPSKELASRNPDQKWIGMLYNSGTCGLSHRDEHHVPVFVLTHRRVCMSINRQDERHRRYIKIQLFAHWPQKSPCPEYSKNLLNNICECCGHLAVFHATNKVTPVWLMYNLCAKTFHTCMCIMLWSSTLRTKYIG